VRIFLDILVAIAVFVIANSVILTAYCRIQEKLDIKQKNRKAEKQAENTGEKKQSKSIAKKMYWWLYGYAYGWMRYCIIRTGKIPSNRIRNFLYRVVFNMKITSKTVIYGGCEFRSPWNIHACNCVISTYCILDGRNGIFIEDNVVFGSGVHIWTEEHAVNDPLFGISEEGAQPVKIEERAWICSDSTVLPGVHIGRGAVLASKAVATKDLEAFGIYAGIPARKIQNRIETLCYELQGKPHWHFW